MTAPVNHVWPCGHKDCTVSKATKKAIENHEKSHGGKS